MLNILNWISFRNYLNTGKDLLKATERERKRDQSLMKHSLQKKVKRFNNLGWGGRFKKNI